LAPLSAFQPEKRAACSSKKKAETRGTGHIAKLLQGGQKRGNRAKVRGPQPRGGGGGVLRGAPGNGERPVLNLERVESSKKEEEEKGEGTRGKKMVKGNGRWTRTRCFVVHLRESYYLGLTPL